ncbi:MAG TPA: EamA family transporter [Gemmatimonadaceae bacterium]|nr:EamA family transporter [Gemmatimonadaceae bacterium]
MDDTRRTAPADARPAAPSRAQLIAAFAAVYLIWGSTYLAIRFVVESMPPFLMASARFLVAGAGMAAWALARGAPWPTTRMWRDAAIIGTLLLLGGNGGVVWAEQFVASGIAALLVACVPLWVVVVDWVRPGGRRPTLGVVAGVLVGLVGLVLLVGPETFAGRGTHLGAALVLIFASLSWATGSVFSRGASRPSSPVLGTGMQMLAGGAALGVLALATGEPARFEPAAVTARAFWAWMYLLTFGSVVGFTAYVWLLRVVPAARAATYAYVNPVVAVFLGWALASEPITGRTLVAAAIIIGAVALITTADSAKPAAAPRAAPPPRVGGGAGGAEPAAMSAGGARTGEAA